MYLVQRAWEDAQVDNLLGCLEGHRPGAGATDDLRGFEWHYWNRLGHAALATFSEHKRPIVALAFSSDGRLLMSASEREAVKVWDVVTGAEKLALIGNGGNRGARRVVFGPGDKTVIATF